MYAPTPHKNFKKRRTQKSVKNSKSVDPKKSVNPQRVRKVCCIRAVSLATLKSVNPHGMHEVYQPYAQEASLRRKRKPAINVRSCHFKIYSSKPIP